MDEMKIKFDRRKTITADIFPFKKTDARDIWKNSWFSDYYWHYSDNCIEIALNNKIYKLEQVSLGEWEQHKFRKDNKGYSRPISLITSNEQEKYIDFIPTDYNLRHRNPILIYSQLGIEIENISTHRKSGLIKNFIEFDIEAIPLLKTFGFHKVLSAEEVYVEIEAFLGWLKDNPPIEDKRTDLAKLQDKGFDKKISFRHRNNK